MVLLLSQGFIQKEWELNQLPQCSCVLVNQLTIGILQVREREGSRERERKGEREGEREGERGRSRERGWDREVN